MQPASLRLPAAFLPSRPGLDIEMRQVMHSFIVYQTLEGRNDSRLGGVRPDWITGALSGAADSTRGKAGAWTSDSAHSTWRRRASPRHGPRDLPGAGVLPHNGRHDAGAA